MEFGNQRSLAATFLVLSEYGNTEKVVVNRVGKFFENFLSKIYPKSWLVTVGLIESMM
jgi:hypothetical protein